MRNQTALFCSLKKINVRMLKLCHFVHVYKVIYNFTFYQFNYSSKTIIPIIDLDNITFIKSTKHVSISLKGDTINFAYNELLRPTKNRSLYSKFALTIFFLYRILIKNERYNYWNYNVFVISEDSVYPGFLLAKFTVIV